VAGFAAEDNSSALVILTKSDDDKSGSAARKCKGRGAMAKEIEIQAAVRDRKAFERKIKKLGGKSIGSRSGRVHEFNVIFDTPDGGLANTASCCGFERRHRKDQARGPLLLA